jgi:hypothetical protein
MPITDVIILSIVIVAFVAFAVVLAWGDHQTREIARASRERALSGLHVASLERTAAERSDRKAEAKGKTPAHA